MSNINLRNYIMYDIQRYARIKKIKFGDIISMIKNHDKTRHAYMNTVDISEKWTNK